MLEALGKADAEAIKKITALGEADAEALKRISALGGTDEETLSRVKKLEQEITRIETLERKRVEDCV